MLLFLNLDELGAQHLHTGVLVLELAALGLAGHYDAGGLVDQPDSRGGLVDVLAAGAGGAVHLHLDVLGADVHLHAVVDLRGDLHRGKGGLPSCVGVKGGYPH